MQMWNSLSAFAQGFCTPSRKIAPGIWLPGGEGRRKARMTRVYLSFGALISQCIKQ